MSKKICLFAVLLVSVLLQAQQEDAWVYFTDKPDAETYMNNPLLMLSQRSLDRRAMQNIAIDDKDVPIHQPYVAQIGNFVEVLAKSKWLNAVHVRGTQAEISALSNLDFVDHIQFADPSLNELGKRKRNRSSVTGKSLETAVDFQYGFSANQIEMLNGHLVHQEGYTGAGKIIAVMDAGFPGVDIVQPFQRLRDNNLILGGYNFVDRDENVYVRSSHGTMVLSTMGGYKADDLVGTAPDAGYYLFITEDAGSESPLEESLWVEAAELADSLGVDLTNTSLGYFAYDNPNYSYSYDDMDGQTSFIARGADIAFSRGMIVVVSAGNSGNSDDPYISTPADAFNALAVGAVNAAGSYASFSSIGPSADGRVKPDVAAQGQAAVVATPLGAIGTISGTSLSGPIIAGMITSFWQAFPLLTNAQIVQIVKESASQFDFPDDYLGYGIPDFWYALGIAELSVDNPAQARFFVYPNPAQQQVFVSLPNAGEAKIVFYNALGQIVGESSLSPTNYGVDVSNFKKGLYLYTISAGNYFQSGKLIKG